MNPLYQRLKEISKDDFESLIDQLLQAKYPTAGIKRVEGSGGDEGIDNFQGNLSDGPTVWQDKHFPNRLQQAQRKQVLKSIKSAFKNRTPRNWILCVPINLRTNEHNWFQSSIKSPYERKYRGTTVELMQAADIVKDLLHFKTIRDAFFPDAISDVAKLKMLVTNTENLKLSERATVTTEYAQQFLGELKSLDGRFDYELSIGGERTPTISYEPRLVMAFKKGELLTRVFARDLDAIRLDPIRFQVRVRTPAADKLREAAETGRPQTLLADEIVGINSESSLFKFFSEGLEQTEIRVIPQVPDPTRLMPLRLVFGTGIDAKEIKYLPFKQEYFGEREITLRGETPLPIEIRLTLRLGAEATMTIRPLFDNADFGNLQQVLQFVGALKKSPYIEIFSVEFGFPIMQGEVPFPPELDFNDGLLKVIEYAAIVSKHFGVALKMPAKITDNDLETLERLKRVATGEWFEANTITSSFTKDIAHQVQQLALLDGSPVAFGMQAQSDEEFQVFGTTINAGRSFFECAHVTVANITDTRERYLAAAPGESVSIILNCVGKCRFISSKLGSA
jgi:hypothetical protein